MLTFGGDKIEKYSRKVDITRFIDIGLEISKCLSHIEDKNKGKDIDIKSITTTFYEEDKSMLGDNNKFVSIFILYSIVEKKNIY